MVCRVEWERNAAARSVQFDSRGRQSENVDGLSYIGEEFEESAVEVSEEKGRRGEGRRFSLSRVAS